MSQITRSNLKWFGPLLMAIITVITLAGCSSPNSETIINPDTGTHIAAGWANPAVHGATAKAAPGSSGFASCQECHGDNFAGGISAASCLNTAGCHGAGVNAPHSPAPWRGGARTHTTTNSGNAAVCALCHLNGRTPPSYEPVPTGVQPGCFNNTLCHAEPGHPAGWADPASHGADAKKAPTVTTGFSSCQPCHGSDFAGGTVQRTCLDTAGCHGAGVNAPHSPAPWRGGARTHTTTNSGNAAVCALCHQSNAGTPGCFNNTLCHAQVGAPHAVPYIDPALHGPAAKADLTYCQGCHANPASGGVGSNPRFNVAIGSLANGCEDCHATNTAHPVPWRGSLPSVLATAHVTAGNMANACALCHGASLGGGVGPACSTCHTAGSPLTLTNCTSCHGRPPTGTTAPNREGAHAEHNALPKVVNNCSTCHNNAGTGTLNHDYAGGTVNVAFLAAYNGNAGTGTYTAASFSCSNVSCHGGPRTQTSTQAGQNPPQSTLTQTPSWRTGAITVNTQCTACHVLGSAAGNPEDNSYYSGEHERHVYRESIACTTCHNTTSLAVSHFTNLDTPAMEGPASATLNTALQYNGTSCNPSAGGLSGCHGSHGW